MESLSTTIFQYLHAIWRRKWMTAFAAWAICIVGWTVISMMPSKYESSARVYVDADGLLGPLLRGLAVEVDPAQQLDVLQRTLLSRPNLEELIRMADLDSRARTTADKEALIRSLPDAITIKPQTKNLFTISYDDTNPTVARNVVQALLTIFAESTTGTTRQQMDNAQRFLTDQIAGYEQQLRAAEQRRADFRAQHLDILSGAGATQELQNARQRLADANNQLQDTIARRDALKQELGQLPQGTTVSGGQVVSGTGPIAQQLADSQRQLADLRTRYTDQHPDVVALKTQIADLESRLGGDHAAPGTSNGRTTVTNGVYEQVQVQLVEQQSQVASLQQRFNDASADVKRLTGLAASAPTIEAQAQDIDRNYDVLKKNYDELLSRREATNLSQAADTKADQIQFRIVDAPQVALTPVAPNRPVLFSAVLLAGVLGGLLIPIMLAQIDRSFATLQRLRNLGLPIVGGVSYVAMFRTRAQATLETAGFGATALALLMLYAVLIAITFDFHRALSGGGIGPS
ncbi:MAG TPA: XrtA system polysaccharide chain length determinant [Stellaceae bacterium]|jgi:polysaccharide chain length determinant protein (PEP-CTERM system associated)|nr:XrtA system polysaccharide chain length determinant [Stellaceae bacterium]